MPGEIPGPEEFGKTDDIRPGFYCFFDFGQCLFQHRFPVLLHAHLDKTDRYFTVHQSSIIRSYFSSVIMLSFWFFYNKQVISIT